MKRSIALPMFAAGMFAVLLTLGAARAADNKIYVMKISLPTLNDSTHQLSKNYAAAVERDSGGRIKAEIYPSGARSHVRSRARNSGRSSARYFRQNFLSALTNALRCSPLPASSILSSTGSVSPAILRS